MWADIPGTERPDEIVLVTAHHDAWFVGADDNASGVAVILEVARVLAGWDRGEPALAIGATLAEVAIGF